MQFFLDASFMFALFNEDDEFHDGALRIVKELEDKLAYFLTSNIALAETVNLLFRMQGSKQAKKFLKGFRESNIEEVFLSQRIFNKGYKILFAQKSRRGLNYFDCLHIAAMKSLKVDEILTFDKRRKKK